MKDETDVHGNRRGKLFYVHLLSVRDAGGARTDRRELTLKREKTALLSTCHSRPFLISKLHYFQARVNTGAHSPGVVRQERGGVLGGSGTSGSRAISAVIS